jgi:hypothetical protein
MFTGVSLNIETPIADRSNKFKSQFDIGRPEWQQNYKSTHNEYYTPMNVYQCII